MKWASLSGLTIYNNENDYQFMGDLLKMELGEGERDVSIWLHGELIRLTRVEARQLICALLGELSGEEKSAYRFI